VTQTPSQAPAPVPQAAVPQTSLPQTMGQAWRGVAAEDVEDIPASLASLLRLRGRRLLQDLLRPHRATAGLILLLIVMANLAALAGPWLVG
jgi:ATP-binding cassette subfamily B protein